MLEIRMAFWSVRPEPMSFDPIPKNLIEINKSPQISRSPQFYMTVVRGAKCSCNHFKRVSILTEALRRI